MANPLAKVVHARIAELRIQQAEVWRRMGMDNSGPLSAWLKEGTDESMPKKWLDPLANALGYELGSPEYERLAEAYRDLRALVQLDEDVAGPLLRERDRARLAVLSLVEFLTDAGFKVPSDAAEYAEVIRQRLGR